MLLLPSEGGLRCIRMVLGPKMYSNSCMYDLLGLVVLVVLHRDKLDWGCHDSFGSGMGESDLVLMRFVLSFSRSH